MKIAVASNVNNNNIQLNIANVETIYQRTDKKEDDTIEFWFARYISHKSNAASIDSKKMDDPITIYSDDGDREEKFEKENDKGNQRQRYESEGKVNSKINKTVEFSTVKFSVDSNKSEQEGKEATEVTFVH